jgi:hypothetical protein
MLFVFFPFIVLDAMFSSPKHKAETPPDTE